MSWYIITKPKRTLATVFRELIMRQNSGYDANLIVKSGKEEDYAAAIEPLVRNFNKRGLETFTAYKDGESSDLRDVAQRCYMTGFLNAGERETLFDKIASKRIPIS